MKTTLTYEFKLPEDNHEFRVQTQAAAMYAALCDIAQYVFRPARKHGYQDDYITKVLEAANTAFIPTRDYDISAGTELIGALERKFYDILKQHDVEIE